ncbi:hypothetical protein Airi01_090450 [Actinoallomurus iriomotensis]|uniref:HTH cro/C1-type domain-containing protein n=1 Tax=Actinoallomurus iriomotensis TaxID=478107 RepID=A0A9W6RS52_9ACTN|nr:hypothetical protein Airi01_090450 [Actinoallomurus iriomotensis]
MVQRFDHDRSQRLLEQMYRARTERVARGVRDRRRQLGLSMSAAARAAGIEREAWASLESRSRPTVEFSQETEERIEWVLQWAPGSLWSIALCGTPVVPDASSAASSDLDPSVRTTEPVPPSRPPCPPEVASP